MSKKLLYAICLIEALIIVLFAILLLRDSEAPQGFRMTPGGGSMLSPGFTPAFLTASTDQFSVGTSTKSGRFMIWGLGTGTGEALTIASNASTSLFAMLDNGRLGVGSSTPADWLSVRGTAATTTLSVYGTIAAAARVQGTATTTVYIDSTHASRGACLKLKDADGGGYTYLSVIDGTSIFSAVSCE